MMYCFHINEGLAMKILKWFNKLGSPTLAEQEKQAEIKKLDLKLYELRRDVLLNKKKLPKDVESLINDIWAGRIKSEAFQIYQDQYSKHHGRGFRFSWVPSGGSRTVSFIADDPVPEPRDILVLSVLGLRPLLGNTGVEQLDKFDVRKFLQNGGELSNGDGSFSGHRGFLVDRYKLR